jgi:hypothetical protein
MKFTIITVNVIPKLNIFTINISDFSSSHASNIVLCLYSLTTFLRAGLFESANRSLELFDGDCKGYGYAF